MKKQHRKDVKMSAQLVDSMLNAGLHERMSRGQLRQKAALIEMGETTAASIRMAFKQLKDVALEAERAGAV